MVIRSKTVCVNGKTMSLDKCKRKKPCETPSITTFFSKKSRLGRSICDIIEFSLMDSFLLKMTQLAHLLLPLQGKVIFTKLKLGGTDNTFR